MIRAADAGAAMVVRAFAALPGVRAAPSASTATVPAAAANRVIFRVM
ncbi:hypothetical protein [Actinoallomurus sp. NPDC050550]